MIKVNREVITVERFPDGTSKINLDPEKVQVLNNSSDMLVLLSSRKSTASYNPLFEEIPTMLTQHFTEFSSMVVYPEQLTGAPHMDTLLMEIPPASKTWSIVSYLKRILLRIIPFHK